MINQNSSDAGQPKRAPVSRMRKRYIVRLIGRCIVLAVSVIVACVRPDEFRIIESGKFFSGFSLLHLLWGIWVADMLLQLFPSNAKISLGSIKMFPKHFRPIYEKANLKALKQYIITTTQAAYRVMLLWVTLIAVIGLLHWKGVINDLTLFMITLIFYVCDLICVLIWCPFRLLMKTRCCTTCRIFNWDHLMMFSPLVFIDSFYARSLFILSVLAWLAWEIAIMLYPERFWEHTNSALKCANCTDKLCTQYCRKLRT